MGKQPKEQRVDSESLFLAKVGVRQGKGKTAANSLVGIVLSYIIMAFVFLVQTLPRFRTCFAIHSSIRSLYPVFITAIFFTTLLNM